MQLNIIRTSSLMRNGRYYFSPFIYKTLNLQNKNSCLRKSNNKISVTSDIQMTPPLWQKVKKTKEPFDESERGK